MPGMGPWNVLVTVRPAPAAVHELLSGLRAHGAFQATPFKYVCAGLVPDTAAFLDLLLEAQGSSAAWATHMARVVPIASTFEFTAESLLPELRRAAASMVPHVPEARFFVRVERRGMAGAVHSGELEPALADHLADAAALRGCILKVSFEDPDFIVAVETLENHGGVALITREMRRRYPFVQVR